jgi:ubiquinone/menaquinone biosynthesis C-methylase UbiE
MTPAEAYERFLVPTIFGPWAEAALRAAPPEAGARVLDVACGTGVGARGAAAAVGPAGLVVGLDLDPGMLATGRAIAAASDGARIRWCRGNALSLPFGDGRLDHLLCLEGIQFFPDRAAGLREMRRVLRPGGRLVATVWAAIEDNPAYHALADGLRAFVSPDAARLPPFSFTVREALEASLRDAGFVEVTVTTQALRFTAPSASAFVEWVASGGPTIRHNLARLGEDRRQAFHRLVAERLACYESGDGLSLPSTRHVVVAR